MTAWAALLGFCSVPAGPVPSRPPAASAAVASRASTPLRPWAAAASSDATAAAAAVPEAGQHRLPLLGAGALCAAAWRRARGDRGASGRIVVRGRNYETNIKKKKGPADIARGRVTGKHLNKIIMACKEGMPDEDANPTLKRLIKLALKDNVPRSTIDRRIKTFVDGKEAIDEINVSGVVHGAGVIVECVTSNSNRCRMDVRKCFTDAGFEIGSGNSCDHLFNKLGVITYADADEDAVVEAAMEADVEDCEAKEDGTVQVLTLPENFHSTMEALEKQDLEPSVSEVRYLPTMEAQLNDQQTYEFKTLLHYLDEVDEVQDIHHNAILTDQEITLDTYGRPVKFKPKAKA